MPISPNRSVAAGGHGHASDVKRFFMLIPEAVSLVLHAAAKAHSGGTYVLDMGEQIRLPISRPT